MIANMVSWQGQASTAGGAHKYIMIIFFLLPNFPQIFITSLPTHLYVLSPSFK